MTRPAIERELYELAAARCRDELSLSEQDRLEELLTTNVDLQRQYMQYLHLHISLSNVVRDSMADIPGQLDLREPVEIADEASRLGRVWAAFYDVASNYIALSLLISAIVMAIIVLSMGLIVPDWNPIGPRELSTEFVARITRTHQATWDETSDGNFTNVDLMVGETIVLNSGLAEITYDTGATITLEGPVEYRLQGRNSGSLKIGKLTGRVEGESAKGFAVETTAFTVKDLGTEFTISVEKSGLHELSVTEGVVEVLEKDGTKIVALTAGKAWRQSPTEVGQVVELTNHQPVRLPNAPATTPASIDEPTERAFVHWSFDESGPQFVDSGSGFSRGPYHIVIDERAAGFPQRVAGRFGQALSFDGKSSLQTRFAGIVGGKARTVACWIRVPAGERSSYPIVGWGTPDSPGTKWQVGWNPNGKQGRMGALRCEVGYGAAVGGPDLRDGKWHHIAVVLPLTIEADVGQLLLFVDGRRVTETDILPSPIDTGTDIPLIFGRVVHGTKHKFRGDIDEVFVSNWPLADNEIHQLVLGKRMPHSYMEDPHATPSAHE